MIFRKPLAAKTKIDVAVQTFHSDHYLRHNSRRLEHLATLDLPLSNRTVLEVGAGIGDHTSFYLDRGCTVLVTEARDENLDVLRNRFGADKVRHVDMENPFLSEGPFDICHSYGLLYHLNAPAKAIEFMAAKTSEMLVLETCVSYGNGLDVNLIAERQLDPSQAVSGTGCRPTRLWIFEELKKHFEFAYVTTTQPWHEEFPLNWTKEVGKLGELTRSVFVASRHKLDNPRLSASLLTSNSR